MNELRDDVRRQLLAAEKAAVQAGEPENNEFVALLNDRITYLKYFHAQIWLALPTEDRERYLNEYAVADDIARPFIASGILKRVSELPIEEYTSLNLRQGRSRFIH